MQEALGIVIFVVVGVGVVLAVISLFGRSRLYDDIGRGGLSIGEDRDLRAGAGGTASGPPVSAAEREEEIRQMLAARNTLREARGEAPLDVDAEMEALMRGSPEHDPALREEVRQLVIARNHRRRRQGKEPLDVETEVDRQLRAFGG